MSTLLWIVFPYVCLAVFIGGHVWRYQCDKFGWTTRSSQLYERKLLRIASPLFHFGMLGVFVGHVLGLVIPQSFTDWLGISPAAYHIIAMAGGIPAGVAALLGLALLIYRRRTVGPVFRATTINDKVMYLMLAVVMVLGIWNTIAGGVFEIGGEYNYREGVSPYWRSIFYFQPDVSLIENAPLGFQLHALTAFLLFAIWPFTRLVHVFSAPIGYLTRPYIVYRSRDVRAGAGTGSRAPKRGWEKVQ